MLGSDFLFSLPRYPDVIERKTLFRMFPWGRLPSKYGMSLSKVHLHYNLRRKSTLSTIGELIKYVIVIGH